MSAAYLVLYEGRPDRPEEFLSYYVDHHVPIIWTWPRIRGVQLELGAGKGNGQGSGIFMIARFLFDTVEDLEAALRSEGRERARMDRDNIPAFSGTVRHQVVEIRELAR